MALIPGGDTLLYPVAEELLDCLCTALTELATDVFPAPGICCIRAGDNVAVDMGEYQNECCEGLAYVKINGIYPTGGAGSPFPSPSSDFALNKCAPYAWGVQLEMAVFRCVSAEIIPCDYLTYGSNSWEYVAQRQMLDAKAMRQALCCFMAPRDGGDVSMGVMNSTSREGACMGVTWPLSVQVRNCEGC